LRHDGTRTRSSRCSARWPRSRGASSPRTSCCATSGDSDRRAGPAPSTRTPAVCGASSIRMVRATSSTAGACPSVICLSPFPCANQAITGSSGRSCCPQCCVWSRGGAPAGQVDGTGDARRTRKEHCQAARSGACSSSRAGTRSAAILAPARRGKARATPSCLPRLGGLARGAVRYASRHESKRPAGFRGQGPCGRVVEGPAGARPLIIRSI
jgi:hypothetical protein